MSAEINDEAKRKALIAKETGRLPRQILPIDPIETAKRIIRGGNRGVTSISHNEIRALCMAILDLTGEKP